MPPPGASQRLDLATRSIDFALTLSRNSSLDLVGLVADTTSRLARETIKWLARERISENAFLDCMRLGQNMATPNQNGVQILNSLTDSASRLIGLNLIMPGALGRTIQYDSSLRWICTTEAVILKYQSPVYAVEVICDLFASAEFEENDPRIPAVKARIRPVITKLVDSIQLHTVNMRHEIRSLPESIDTLPKHYVSDTVLSKAIRTILDLNEADLLVQMDGCVIELVEWIFHHWVGELVVTINNEIVFDGRLGDSLSQLKLLISNECTAESDCHDEEHIRSFQIGKSLGTTFVKTSGKVFDGTTDPGIGYANQSSYRSAFYDIRNPFYTRIAYLNQKEQKAAERAAQDIVRSILALPMSPLPVNLINTELGLWVDAKSNTKYRWWLKKTPTILQKNLGSERSPRRLYAKKRRPTKDDDEEVSFTTTQMAEWYPEIAATLQLVFERCECGCNDEGFETTLDKEMDTGCLIALAFAEILLRIAHAMAEAAGASDVSNLFGFTSANNLTEATVALLGSIAYFGEIYWDTWFRLVSAAVTGLPYDMADEDTVDAGGGIVLWVAGSITIAPAWLKLDSPIQLEASWGVQQLVGAVAGLEAESAVIESQCSSAAKSTNIPAAVTVSSGEDDDTISLDIVVFSATEDLYRMACAVKTKRTLRILNITDVYKGAIYAARPICDHIGAQDATIYPWSLEEVILGWNNWKVYEGNHANIALLGSSVTKQNVAMGFIPGKCVVQGPNCCFRCLAELCMKKGFYGISSGGETHVKRIRYR